MSNPVPKKGSISVRRAVRADAAQTAECLSELGYGTSADLVAECLQEWTDSPNNIVLIAVDSSSGQIIGAASVHVIPLLHTRGSLARLTSLAVRSTAFRRGVGRKLVAAAETFARHAGCRRLEVTSSDQRTDAHKFYRSLGYAVNSRRFIKHLDAASEAT
jgi:ribosomal protein S18 acetylase RimI-like enzyme